MAVDQKACNSLLLKVNQIGTVSESINAHNLAKASGNYYFIPEKELQLDNCLFGMIKRMIVVILPKDHNLCMLKADDYRVHSYKSFTSRHKLANHHEVQKWCVVSSLWFMMSSKEGKLISGHAFFPVRNCAREFPMWHLRLTSRFANLFE